MARMPKCDCLNWCGDDSRVPNGKAKPCQRWLKEQADAEERWDREKDAERYRALRRGQKWSVIDGIGDTLRGDELDAAIDATLVPNACGEPGLTEPGKD